MPREQILKFGQASLHKQDEEEVLYFLAGRRLYVVGAESGEYPPLGWRRPGFLVGKRIDEVGPEERPVRAAHLLNEMGGIWAQPIKVLDGFYFAIREDGAEEEWDLRNSSTFVNHFADVQFCFRRNGFEVERQDFVDEDEPVLFSTLTIANKRDTSTRFTLRLSAQVNIVPAWFAGWVNGRDELLCEGDVVIAYDAHWPDRWAVVFGSISVPSACNLREADGKRTATLQYNFELAPGQRVEVPFLFVAENQRGFRVAQQRFRRLAGRHHPRLKRKVTAYQQAILGGVKFQCSDPEFVNAYCCAKANLQLLLADLAPYLGRYFFAGVPEYVQLFGTDTSYSVPGIVASGFAGPARDALSLLLRYGRNLCGRIPHEVTTNGRVFHPGNPQDTPQFAIACWNYFRWTGDREFLAEAYPVLEEGLLDYLVAFWDNDLDFYPDGQSMIERRGADEENVDAVAYFCRSLYCLADMADALGHRDSAARYRDQLADVLRVSLNHDFWMESEAIFADSLRADHSPRLDGYWTVIVPLETGIADPDKAERSIATIAHGTGWLNEYGLVHTRNREPLVWTLPTGLLARVAFDWGYTELGMRLLRNIALTTKHQTKHGMLGAFEELIPEGLSFVQLWSPAIFLQGISEGIFGLSPFAHMDRVELFPHPPEEWTHARLEKVRIGEREISVGWERRDGDVLRVKQHSGARLSYVLRWYERDYARVTSGPARPVATVKEKKGQRNVLRVDFALEPGEEIEIVLR